VFYTLGGVNSTVMDNSRINIEEGKKYIYSTVLVVVSEIKVNREIERRFGKRHNDQSSF
jgi:hypothetical protein